ncbi:MAG: YceI family protein, partial [Flavobacteriales bacterium]
SNTNNIFDEVVADEVFEKIEEIYKREEKHPSENYSNLANLTVTSIEDSAKAANLQGHLTSGDFFLTDSFPTASFEITSVDTMSGDFNSKVSGNLTIKGISKNITFNANTNITEDMVSVSSETFEVNRLDWDLNYKAEGFAGVIANESIHNDIAFTINVSVNK